MQEKKILIDFKKSTKKRYIYIYMRENVDEKRQNKRKMHR